MNERRHMRILAGLAVLASASFAQERTGEAQIGYQHYYLTNGSRRVANAAGLTLGFRQYFPKMGVLTVNLMPATSNGRFQTGMSFAELKQLPWAKQYWTFRAGDFRLPGRLQEVPFSNLYYPDIAGRGGWMEATHGGRTVGAFYGYETLQAGVRVPLRLVTPQMMAGGYYRQKFGDRLVLGARVMQLATDLNKLRESSQIALPVDPIREARTGMVNAMLTVAGPLKWYSEAAFSEGTREISTGRAGGRISGTFGPMLETERLTVRGNYVYQTDSYLPLLGYYLGDRKGPFGEIRVRPFSRLEFFASGSQYRNNLASNPLVATFRTATESAGASVRLPARFSLSAQLSNIELITRRSDADPWMNASNQQVQISLARPMGRHNLLVSVRTLQQVTGAGSQRQKTLETGDTFQYGWITLGAQVRAQELSGDQPKKSVFVRANAQLNWKRLSAYANVESGNDLANRTLFATSATNSTVLGGSAHLRQNWDFSMEAFRSKLVSELNPENVFVLQGQGVFVPTILSALNQWSLYFRMTKRLEWGKAVPTSMFTLDKYAVGTTLLKGAIEGFVTGDHRRGVDGVPVVLDGTSTVVTDATGKFRFDGVGEGARRVGLALNELPSEYDPGRSVETTVLVKPGGLSRVDLDVVVVGYSVRGSVSGPKDSALGGIVLRLLPTDRYTTTDNNGRFSFYNVKAGKYEVAVEEDTLSQFAVLKAPARVPVTLGGEETPQLEFVFAVFEPVKAVRQILVAPQPMVVKPSVPTPVEEPEVAAPPSPQNVPEASLAVAVPAPSPSARPGARTALPVVKAATVGPTPLQLYQEGRRLSEAEKFAEAIPVLSRSIESRRDYPLAFNTRGFAYMKLAKFAEALEDFNEAIRLNPSYRNAYQNRAAVKRRLGDTAGAKADREKADSLP